MSSNTRKSLVYLVGVHHTCSAKPSVLLPPLNTTKLLLKKMSP